MVAIELTGEERDRIYETQKQQQPQFAEYEQKTDRKIPVVELKPKSAAAPPTCRSGE